MNYYEIGQRIRKYRKALNLSQEELAEIVNISTTHMSHIETGNTKLSLPVLVDISNALNVSADSLLFDKTHQSKTDIIVDLEKSLDSCSLNEVKIVCEVMKATAEALKKNR